MLVGTRGGDSEAQRASLAPSTAPRTRAEGARGDPPGYRRRDQLPGVGVAASGAVGCRKGAPMGEEEAAGAAVGDDFLTCCR